MKLLQISVSDYGGGAEGVARDLHAGLVQRGVESHLLVGRRRRVSGIEAEALYSRDRLASRVWSRTRQYVESATGRQASTSRAFPRWWKRNGGNWDVVLCHNLHGVYFDLDYYPQMAASQPTVQVLHDLWQLTGHCAYPMECQGFQHGCGSCPDLAKVPAVWRDGTASEWTRKVELLRRAAPALVCVSQWVSDQVSMSGLGELPRLVIPCGIPDTRTATESREQIRERLRWPRDRQVYLYVSSGGLRGTSYKDPDTLIAAVSELRRQDAGRDKLIVTVGGKRAIDPELSSLVRQYDHVSAGLEDFYRAADYFVYPTRIETVGLGLVEAARAGLPSITVSVGGCPEVVRHGETGLVVAPCDAAALASAMCDMATMDRQALGAAARRYYLSRFTRDRMVGSYLELFDRLISERVRPKLSPSMAGV